jgi:hypothetical protein
MSFGVREGTAEAAMENADENKARLQDNCMGKAAPQFKIVNGLTQFLEPTSRSGSSFSEGPSLSELFGIRYAHGLLIATFCKGLEALKRPARILDFQGLFRSKIPVARAVLRSDLWRIEEGFRIPLPETRRCVKLRWEFWQKTGAKSPQEQYQNKFRLSQPDASARDLPREQQSLAHASGYDKTGWIPGLVL